MSIQRFEAELESADMRRDEILRELRNDLRVEHDQYLACEHRLELEGPKLRLKVVRNHGLQAQLALSESK